MLVTFSIRSFLIASLFRELTAIKWDLKQTEQPCLSCESHYDAVYCVDPAGSEAITKECLLLCLGDYNVSIPVWTVTARMSAKLDEMFWLALQL